MRKRARFLLHSPCHTANASSLSTAWSWGKSIPGLEVAPPAGCPASSRGWVRPGKKSYPRRFCVWAPRPRRRRPARVTCPSNCSAWAPVPANQTTSISKPSGWALNPWPCPPATSSRGAWPRCHHLSPCHTLTLLHTLLCPQLDPEWRISCLPNWGGWTLIAEVTGTLLFFVADLGFDTICVLDQHERTTCNISRACTIKEVTGHGWTASKILTDDGGWRGDGEVEGLILVWTEGVFSYLDACFCVHFTYYWTLDLNQSPFILVRLHQQVIIVKAKTDRTLLLLHHPKQHMTTNNSHWIVTVCVIKQCCEELSHFYTHHTFLQHSYHASSSYLTHLSVQAYLRDNTIPMALGKKNSHF